MNRPCKLIRLLSNVLFVPTVMLILAGVVKYSETSDHRVHESLDVTAHDTSETQSVRADNNRNNKLFENHRGEIRTNNMNR